MVFSRVLKFIFSFHTVVKHNSCTMLFCCRLELSQRGGSVQQEHSQELDQILGSYQVRDYWRSGVMASHCRSGVTAGWVTAGCLQHHCTSGGCCSSGVIAGQRSLQVRGHC